MVQVKGQDDLSRDAVVILAEHVEIKPPVKKKSETTIEKRS